MTGPLSGLKVVELVGLGPGPFAAMLLADLGADVLRIDRAGGNVLDLPAGTDILARGRRSVAVNLKDPAGVELVLQLVERADVLLEGFRPGVTERLGLGPVECAARNPRLVYGRMTGWGQDGPLAHSAGHDIAYVAVTGVLGAIGRAGEPPQIPLNVVGDFGGGSMFLVLGILAALWEAGRSGQGQVIDAAIVDGVAVLAALQYSLRAAAMWSDARGTNLLDGGVPSDVYATADGGHMAVGALEPQFYAELLRVLGLADDPDLPAQHDRARHPELRARLAARFAERTRAEWDAVFAGTDACVAPVLTFGEAREAHPHLMHRQTYVERGGVVQPVPAPRFSRTPAELGAPPAKAGAHSRAALADWGIDGVEELLAAGVVVQA